MEAAGRGLTAVRKNPPHGNPIDNLPPEIRKTAVEKVKLWQENPRHPGLKTEKIKGMWFCRINSSYRFGYEKRIGERVIVFAGDHDEYMRYIRRL